MPATLALATGLVVLLVLLAATVLAAGAPQFMGAREGGEARIVVGPMCTGPEPPTPCFRSATARVEYGSGVSAAVALSNMTTTLRATLPLEEARASLHVRTDLGEWTREIWIPGGATRQVEVRPDEDPEPGHVIGRPLGYAFLFFLGALIVAGVVSAGVPWLRTGSVAAAAATQQVLTHWMYLQVIAFLVLLPTRAVLAGVALLIAVWLWWLRRRATRWIDQAEGRTDGVKAPAKRQRTAP